MPDAFHRALAALNPPTGEPEVVAALAAALRHRHDMQEDGFIPPSTDGTRCWGCSRCASVVIWTPDGGMYDGAVRWSCADSLRGDLAQGSELEPAAAAWLAEQEGASRG